MDAVSRAIQGRKDRRMSDTISRQAAIDALRKMQTYKMFSGDDMLLIDQAGAMTELMLLPPAEPKRGRWIYHIDDLFPAESTMECNQIRRASCRERV